MRIASNIFYEMRMKVTTDTMDRYPDLPSRTIARILHKQHPELYPTIEVARCTVRILRGAMGANNLKTLKNRNYVKSI